MFSSWPSHYTTTTTNDDNINAAPIQDLIWKDTLTHIEDVHIHYLLLVSKIFIAVNLSDLHHYRIYSVTLTSVKHFKNSQQIDYAMNYGNSYADTERNYPSFFSRKRLRT
jgi:hypothetical protein